MMMRHDARDSRRLARDSRATRPQLTLSPELPIGANESPGLKIEFCRVPGLRNHGRTGKTLFFPQALLGGFSFRAGEHTTSAVRKIAGPNQNDYTFQKSVPEKRARSIFDDRYTIFSEWSQSLQGSGNKKKKEIL